MKRYIPHISALAAFAILFSSITMSIIHAGGPSNKSFFKPHNGAYLLGSGLLGSGGQYVTTVNKVASQTSLSGIPSSLTFQNLSKSFTSSGISLLDQSVNSGGTSNMMPAFNSGSMQMFYAYSTTLDGTLTMFNSTYGTGSAVGTVALTSGVPYEWDSATASGGTTSLNLTPSNSITFTPGNTSGGVLTSTSASVINAAALYP